MAAVITSNIEQLHAVLVGCFILDVRVCWCDCVVVYEGSRDWCLQDEGVKRQALREVVMSFLIKSSRTEGITILSTS